MIDVLMWIGIALVVVGVGVLVWRISRVLSPSQLAKVQEWLLYAVSEAEQLLGAGTGVLKLRYVYDQFAGRFPKWIPLLSFEVFGTLVKAALERMKLEMEKNGNIKQLIAGEQAQSK